MTTPQTIANADTAGARDERTRGPVGYRPPVIRRLGSLAELTQGGTTTNADGYGGAGASGSI